MRGITGNVGFPKLPATYAEVLYDTFDHKILLNECARYPIIKDKFCITIIYNLIGLAPKYFQSFF